MIRVLVIAAALVVSSSAAPLISQPAPAAAAKPVHEGLPTSDPLYQKIAELDKELFDAYNTCDLDKFASLISDDIEFYHDHDGLIDDKKKLVQAIHDNICGKVQRGLLPETLEVYPIHDYGAVEMGVHRFTHPSNPSDGVGEAKFVHLWRLKDGHWQVTRVFSFDHHSAQ